MVLIDFIVARTLPLIIEGTDLPDIFRLPQLVNRLLPSCWSSQSPCQRSRGSTQIRRFLAVTSSLWWRTLTKLKGAVKRGHQALQNSEISLVLDPIVILTLWVKISSLSTTMAIVRSSLLLFVSVPLLHSMGDANPLVLVFSDWE